MSSAPGVGAVVPKSVSVAGVCAPAAALKKIIPMATQNCARPNCIRREKMPAVIGLVSGLRQIIFPMSKVILRSLTQVPAVTKFKLPATSVGGAKHKHISGLEGGRARHSVRAEPG